MPDTIDLPETIRGGVHTEQRHDSAHKHVTGLAEYTDDIAELIVFNKSDLADPDVLTGLLARYPEAVAVSAATGDGIDELHERLAGLLPTWRACQVTPAIQLKSQ